MNTICPPVVGRLLALALALVSTFCGSSSTSLVAPTGQKCQISVNGFTGTFGPSGGAGSATIDAARECSWSASSQATWISLGSPAEGTGNGTLQFTVQANSAPRARSGALSVNSQELTVSQEPAPCRFTVAPLTVTVAAAGGSASVAVTANDGSCGWTAASQSPWIAVTGGGGNGDGRVAFSVAPNTGPMRSGGALVAGQAVGFEQAARTTTPSPKPPTTPAPAPAPTTPIQLTGDVSGKKGGCPGLSFFVRGVAVVTNADTAFVNIACNRLRNGRRVTVDGVQRAGQPVVAARVTSLQ